MIVEFVIPTYDRYSSLKSMLSCLIAQTNPDWGATVVCDGLETSDEVRNLIHSFNDSRIRLKIVNPRYNDWGHTPRELGKQLSRGEYTIMTGDDNYYVPTFVEELGKSVKDKPGIVYWDMVHNHYDYQLFVTSLGFNQIDIGAFAIRTDLGKQITLPTSYAADGEFIELYKERFPNESFVKIKKVLYVHN